MGVFQNCILIHVFWKNPNSTSYFFSDLTFICKSKHIKAWVKSGWSIEHKTFQKLKRAKRFRWSKSLKAGFIGGKHELGLPSRKWFGHSASKSLGSELTAFKGRALSVCSTRQKVVKRTSSVNFRLPKVAWNTRLELLTSRSQDPPWCGLPGGLNFVA